MTTLPAGETLPEYDDGPADGVDIEQMCAWLKTRRGWDGEQVSLAGYRASQTVRDVLAALQAAGDATLVKNATYRAMRREGGDLERIRAWWANNDPATLIGEHDGDAPGATLNALRHHDRHR